MGEPDLALRESIREHYDRLSGWYARLWGEHIHHGLFEEGDSPAGAQERLIGHLAARAGVERGNRVLDVGCGLGGSSRWLARELGCEVVGITISPVQAAGARRRTARAGLGSRVRFLVADANTWEFPRGEFDVVWVVECSEHLLDKGRFIRRCAGALRAGGRLALCAWMTPDAARPEDGRVLDEICVAMLCPGLASMARYREWAVSAGMEVVAAEDLTARVAPTWDYCESAVRSVAMTVVVALQPRSVRRFVGSFSLMRRAMGSGALRYGLMVAEVRGQG
jgi:tocopherol O-methyltransferase